MPMEQGTPMEPVLKIQPGDIVEGGDHLKHNAACGHLAARPHASHSTGIAAHVAIYLKPCVDIWEAHKAILAIKPIPGLHVEKVHVSLGEIDMLGDVHAMWTDDFDDPPYPRKRGRETRLIGDWVNAVRKLPHTHKGHKADDCECCFVARTSTNVCMMPDS